MQIERLSFQIRAEIVRVLLEFYQRIPTAKYYDVASFNYKHGKKTKLNKRMNEFIYDIE